jgi:hypothetical protein
MSMSSRITDPGATARRFLLGQLSDEETKAFEEQLLTDDELVAETDAVQTELYDQFVRGELTADERAVFAQRFASRRERMIFASALAARATELPRGNIRWALPIAASVMLVTSAILVLSLRPDPAVAPAPVPRASVKHVPAAVPSPTNIAKARKIATVSITLAVTRDDDESPSLTLAADIDDLALRIRLNPADQYPSYAIELSTGDGVRLWEGRSTRDASNSELTVTVPAARLSRGEIQIAVSGIAHDGTREELGYQTLVIRTP